ncbi:hypothetical protein C8F01DRAFT_1118588 [Mycena amicta]|nr:hypothetical protein C8F01DRAFT_1118588 [Mycena amicta]
MMVQGIPPPPPRMNSQPLPGQPSLGWQPPALVPVQRSGSGGSGQRQGGYMQQIPPHLQQHSHPQQNYPPPSYQQQPHHQPGPSHSASQSQQPQAFSLTDARENHAPAMQPYAQQQLIRRYSDGQMVQQPYEYQQQQPQQYLHYQQPPPPPPLHRPSQASHSPTTHAQSPLSLFPPVLSTDTPPTTGTSPSQPLSLGMSYSRSPTQQQPMPIQVPMNPTHIRVQIPPTHPQQHHLPTPPDSGSPLPRPQVQAQAQAPIQTRTQSSIASALGPVPPNQPPLQMSELALNITNFPPWQQSGSGPGSPAVHGGQSLALPERQSQSQLVQVPVRDGDADGGASTSPIVIADETGPSSSRVEPVVSVKTEQQPNVDVAQAEASSSRSQSARAEVEAVRPDVLETDGDVPMLDAADDDDTPSPAQDADTPSEGHEAITPPQSLKRMSADREDASDGDADPRKRPRIGIAEERGGSGHELETVAEEVEVKKELLAEAEAEADSLVVKMELMDDVERARIMAEAEEANEDEFVEVDDEGKRTKDDCVKAMFHQDWICKFCKCVLFTFFVRCFSADVFTLRIRRRAEVVGEPLPPSFVAASLEERAQHCESEHPIAWNHLRNSVNDDESDHDDNDDEDED